MITLGAKDAVDTKNYVNLVKSDQIETKELYKLIKDDVEDLYIVDIREPDQVGHGEIFHLHSKAGSYNGLQMDILLIQYMERYF